MQGIFLLEDLAQRHSEGNRDYVYYLAIGNARIKQYSVSLKFCKAFLQIEPNNQQAITLEVIKTVQVKFSLVEILLISKFLLYTGAHTEKDGKGDNDWCGCGWRCGTCFGWSSWFRIGTSIAKVGYIPFIQNHPSIFFIEFSCDIIMYALDLFG